MTEEFLMRLDDGMLAYFRDMADEMVTRFGISRAEAVARINACYGDCDIEPYPDLMCTRNPRIGRTAPTTCRTRPTGCRAGTRRTTGGSTSPPSSCGPYRRPARPRGHSRNEPGPNLIRCRSSAPAR